MKLGTLYRNTKPEKSARMESINKIWNQLLWSWRPESAREADESVVKNLLIHWFPAKTTLRSLSMGYSLWLGTISLTLFVILSVTGVLLMFLYVPSVERAYLTMKDLDYVVSYGWFLRGLHRMAAHLMVAAVFLHMIRVFYTGAFKNSGAIGSARPLNWIVGIMLLVLTLGLSYSGYLLPWDQLAYWAMMIGANVASSIPVLGEKIRYVLIGGTIVEQNTLIRFYVLHCVFLPLIATALIAYHLWRIRKDGGLACVDRLVGKRVRESSEVVSSKTYSLMGIPTGTAVQVTASASLHEEDTVHSSPHLIKRIFWIATATTAITILLALLVRMPLEAPANPLIAPNPSKAPWYFIWLQELIADTTFTVMNFTVNGGFVGGVLVPGLLVTLLAIWPFMDRSPSEAVGRWFHGSRKTQNIVFTIVLICIFILLFVGAFCRGPYWNFYWPWEKWPEFPPHF
jgi:quinol-cytochrome oxidoreductase complex cytochrome b subunit